MDLVVVESDQIEEATRAALRALWDRAFAERFSADDEDHAYGGIHVVARDGDRLIAHASVVPRRIRFGGQGWLDVGYVEAVATDPRRQGKGVGRRVMERLQEEIASRGWPVAMLSTGRATGFYELLGWERWAGLSYTQTTIGAVPDEEHGGLMIFRIDPSAVPDLSVAATCEDRPGDAW